MTTFENYLKQQGMDPESFFKSQLKQARITAIVLGSTTIFSLICCLFAYLQKTEADNLRQQLQNSEARYVELQGAYEECKTAN